MAYRRVTTAAGGVARRLPDTVAVALARADRRVVRCGPGHERHAALWLASLDVSRARRRRTGCDLSDLELAAARNDDVVSTQGVAARRGRTLFVARSASHKRIRRRRARTAYGLDGARGAAGPG